MISSLLGLKKAKKPLPERETIFNIFQKKIYQQNNLASLSHLNSLGLDLNNKRVLEFGAGVGDHSLFYLYKNCTVLPTDGRPELAAFINERFGIQAAVFDVEKELHKMETLGKHDIVHCYGLLYHLANPAAFLAAMPVAAPVLLLETCVCGDDEPDAINLLAEDARNPSQALSGTGCRPRRDWVFGELKKHYPFVYAPLTQPAHPQFPLDWNIPYSTKTLQRAVFVASFTPIANALLSESLPKVYRSIND